MPEFTEGRATGIPGPSSSPVAQLPTVLYDFPVSFVPLEKEVGRDGWCEDGGREDGRVVELLAAAVGVGLSSQTLHRGLDNFSCSGTINCHR